MYSQYILHSLIVGIITIKIFWLMYLVWFKYDKARHKRLFIILSIQSLIWLLGAYLARIFYQLKFFTSGIILLKIAWFITPFLFFTLFLFVFKNLDIKFAIKKKFFLNVLFIIASSASLLVVFGKLIIREVFINNYNLNIVYGDGMALFLLLVFILMLSTIIVIVKSSQRENRVFNSYLSLGVTIFFISNIVFNIIFPILLSDVQYYYLGDYSLIFLLFFIFLSIKKSNFLSIHVILSEVILLLTSLLIFVNIILFFNIDNQLSFWMSILGLGFIILIMIRHISFQIKKNTETLFSVKKQMQLLECLYGSRIRIMVKQLEILFDDFVKNDTNRDSDYIAIKDIISNLCKFSSDEEFIHFKPVELNKLLSKLHSEYQNKVRKNIDFRLSLDSKLPQVLVEKKYLILCLREIIDNSIKYTKSGSINISTNYHLNDKRVEIKIEDTGLGFDLGEEKRFFEKFYVGNAGKLYNYNPIGLSLALAQEIIKLHQGSIEIKSDGLNKGCKVEIVIPVKPLVTTEFIKDSLV